MQGVRVYVCVCVCMCVCVCVCVCVRERERAWADGWVGGLDLAIVVELVAINKNNLPSIHASCNRDAVVFVFPHPFHSKPSVLPTVVVEMQ